MLIVCSVSLNFGCRCCSCNKHIFLLALLVCGSIKVALNKACSSLRKSSLISKDLWHASLKRTIHPENTCPSAGILRHFYHIAPPLMYPCPSLQASPTYRRTFPYDHLSQPLLYTPRSVCSPPSPRSFGKQYPVQEKTSTRYPPVTTNSIAAQGVHIDSAMSIVSVL